MAIFDNPRRSLMAGIALGIGASAFSREVLRHFRPVLGPLTKASLKAGLHALDRGREATARFGEYVEDMLAEVEAERAAEGALVVEEQPVPPDSTPSQEGR